MLSQLSEFLGSSFLARDKDGDTQTEALTITFGDVFDELSEENSVSGQNDVIDQLPETSEADAASGLTSKELLEADDEVMSGWSAENVSDRSRTISAQEPLAGEDEINATGGALESAPKDGEVSSASDGTSKELEQVSTLVSLDAPRGGRIESRNAPSQGDSVAKGVLSDQSALKIRLEELPTRPGKMLRDDVSRTFVGQSDDMQAATQTFAGKAAIPSKAISSRGTDIAASAKRSVGSKTDMRYSPAATEMHVTATGGGAVAATAENWSGERSPVSIPFSGNPYLGTFREYRAHDTALTEDAARKFSVSLAVGSDRDMTLGGEERATSAADSMASGNVPRDEVERSSRRRLIVPEGNAGPRTPLSGHHLEHRTLRNPPHDQARESIHELKPIEHRYPVHSEAKMYKSTADAITRAGFETRASERTEPLVSIKRLNATNPQEMKFKEHALPSGRAEPPPNPDFSTEEHSQLRGTLRSRVRNRTINFEMNSVGPEIKYGNNPGEFSTKRRPPNSVQSLTSQTVEAAVQVRPQEGGYDIASSPYMAQGKGDYIESKTQEELIAKVSEKTQKYYNSANPSQLHNPASISENEGRVNFASGSIGSENNYIFATTGPKARRSPILPEQPDFVGMTYAARSPKKPLIFPQSSDTLEFSRSLQLDSSAMPQVVEKPAMGKGSLWPVGLGSDTRSADLKEHTGIIDNEIGQSVLVREGRGSENVEVKLRERLVGTGFPAKEAPEPELSTFVKPLRADEQKAIPDRELSRNLSNEHGGESFNRIMRSDGSAQDTKGAVTDIQFFGNTKGAGFAVEVRRALPKFPSADTEESVRYSQQSEGRAGEDYSRPVSDQYRKAVRADGGVAGQAEDGPRLLSGNIGYEGRAARSPRSVQNDGSERQEPRAQAKDATEPMASSSQYSANPKSAGSSQGGLASAEAGASALSSLGLSMEEETDFRVQGTPVQGDLPSPSAGSMANQTSSSQVRSGQSASLIRQLSEVLPQVDRGEEEVVELKLRPEELGHLRFRMTHGEHGLILNISAERTETLDLLRRNIDQLARTLSDLGYESSSFSFDDSPTEQRDSGSAANLRDDGGDISQEPPSASLEPLGVSAPGLDIRI